MGGTATLLAFPLLRLTVYGSCFESLHAISYSSTVLRVIGHTRSSFPG